MAAGPNTPPDTPDPGKGTGTGPANIGGNVNFNKDIKNSVATGHIYGYEVILATINVTVDAASNLTKNIQEFAAKVDLQLQLVSIQINATANVLGSINALVVKQAKKKGLMVDKEVKVAKIIRNEATDRGGKTVKSPEESRQKQDNAANEILSMDCFKAIIERTEGTQKAFNDINKKIKEALKAIGLLQKLHQDGQEAVTGISVGGPGPDGQSAQPHSETPKRKAELCEEDRKTVFLTEDDLLWMEKKVEIHYMDLYHRFIIFEYALDEERRETEEEDTESIKKELERVKLIGKNIYKEMMRLANFLCGNGEPARPRNGFRGPRPRSPPEALRRYLPKPARVNSLYVGWEFRKSLPLPSHPYGHLDKAAHKPSWSFAVPQRMPFSTEELFLRVLAQAAQRAKSDRTLRDDYWDALRKAGQRGLVNELVQSQNQFLQRDFPELEWTIAGLETKTDPWAVIAAHARSRAREKKNRKAITAFEVILKTQWRITGGYGPPMPFPGGIGGPTPVGPSSLDLGLGPLPGDGRGGPPDGYRPQAPRGPLGGPPFPSEGGAGGGQDVPIIITPDAGIYGGPQRVPQIPVNSQTRQRESTRSRHRPKMVLHEPKWVLVKEREKTTKKSKGKKKKGKQKDAGDDDRQQTRKPRVHVEFREPGRDHGTAAAGPSGGGHRPQSPLGPGIPYRPPFVPPLRPPPPPMPLSSFAYADGGHRRVHIPPVPPVARAPPVARPPPPQPTHIHMSSTQTQREEEEEEEEAEEVVEEILEEFSELTDTKGKKKSRRRRRPSEWNMYLPEQRFGSDAEPIRVSERRREEMDYRRRQDAEPDVSISRSLMRQVERAGCRRLAAEGEELHVKSVRLERMAERQAPPPPAFEVPGPAERTRFAREREPRGVHIAEPPLRPYMEVEREREYKEREERILDERRHEQRRQEERREEERRRAERGQEVRERQEREVEERGREEERRYDESRRWEEVRWEGREREGGEREGRQREDRGREVRKRRHR